MAASCDGSADGGARATLERDAAPAPPFAESIERFSEPGGYFDTDNLISNETSYLHVIGKLEEMGVRGGAYLGVGPDQNFSYIAAVRPEIAFIVDIRRDNLIEHLLYRAIFRMARTPAEFLRYLFGRPVSAYAAENGVRGDGVQGDGARGDGARVPEGGAPPPELSVLLDRIAARPPDADTVDAYERRIERIVRSFGVPLSDADLETLRRFHRAFARVGPALRFHSFGRAPRSYYPTYRQLALERDLGGRRVSFLADTARYRVVRDLEEAGLVIPVVGDLAGAHALREIARYLEQADIEVSAFYTSNVEFYLWQAGTFEAFAANVAALPWTPGGVVIRSVFRTFGGLHPHNIPGYFSTQSLQSARSLIRAMGGGGYASYSDLVTRDAIDPRGR